MNGNEANNTEIDVDDESLLTMCDVLEAAVDQYYGSGSFKRITLDITSWTEEQIASRLYTGLPQEQIAILEQIKITPSLVSDWTPRRAISAFVKRTQKVQVVCGTLRLQPQSPVLTAMQSLCFEAPHYVQATALFVWSNAVNYNFDDTVVEKICKLALTTRSFEVRSAATEVLLRYEKFGMCYDHPELMQHGFSPLRHSRRTAERILERISLK